MKYKLYTIAFFIAIWSVKVVANQGAIRGVWVPAPKFTKVLHSYQNVNAFVEKLNQLNFNAIFLVSYAQSKTIYQSKVLSDYTNNPNLSATSLLTPYITNYNIPEQSPTNDPIADLIRVAHQHKIKVFFWYEYGFMGDIKPISSDNPILASNPTFLGIANDGSPANYHQKDYYFNAYDPKVQTFIKNLVLEGIKLYPNVDGIQGDDRLPAMPKNSGYDAYTIEKYKKSHDGKNPPQDFNEKEWVDWRLGILNNFAGEIYHSVKAENRNVMVSFAPNPYPWSKDNLMQDWPQWIKEGHCDLLAVQCYRYQAEAYKNTVSEVVSHISANNNRQLFAPGIILMEGGSIKMTPSLLTAQIKINRELGIHGEIYFYNEALNDAQLQDVFKSIYPTKIKFPKVKRRHH